MAIDLTGDFFNIAQQKIGRGQDINLDFSVVNNGDEDIQPFDFDIVISQDDVIDENDIKIGNYGIRDGLGAGASSGLKSFRYATPDASDPFWLAEDANYTVGLRLDPQNQFSESDEDNNSNQGIGVDYDTVEAITFGESDLVGLRTTIGNAELAPSSYVDLSFAVANVSPDEAANPFSVDIYLSKDNVVSEDDAKLGTYDIRDFVSPDDNTRVKNYSYQLPGADSSIWSGGDGEYNVVLDIDSEDEVSETNEENNSGQNEGLDYASFSLSGSGNSNGNADAADLAVTGFTAPESFEAGETVTVEYELTNTGDAASGVFGTGFYLFDQGYLAGNDSLDISNVPDVFFIQGDRESSLTELDAGETASLTAEITIPEEWSGFSGPGDYFLGAEADAFDDVAEADESNNSLTGEDVDYQQVAITNAPDGTTNPTDTADLAVTGFTAPESFEAGETVTVEYELTNTGDAASGVFGTGFYLFDQGYLAGNDSLDISNVPDVFFIQGDRESSLTELDAGETASLTAEITIPEEWSGFSGPGDYFLGAEVDAFDDVAEADESNNSLTGEDVDYQMVGITNAPGETTEPAGTADLVTGGSFSVAPETVATGETFAVTYDITNAGTADAENFAAGFYLFSEEYLAANDSLELADVPEVFFLQGDRASSLMSLEADGTKTMTTELTMPEDWAGFAGGSGEYYVGVAADPFGDVAESDEMNNSLNGADLDYAKVNVDVI